MQCFNYSEKYLFYNRKCSWWVVTWGRTADGVLDAGFLHHIFLRIPALTWFSSCFKAAVTCPLVKCRPSWPSCSALPSRPLFSFPSRKCLGKREGICAELCMMKSTKILQGPFIFRSEYSQLHRIDSIKQTWSVPWEGDLIVLWCWKSETAGFLPLCTKGKNGSTLYCVEKVKVS